MSASTDYSSSEAKEWLYRNLVRLRRSVESKNVMELAGNFDAFLGWLRRQYGKSEAYLMSQMIERTKVIHLVKLVSIIHRFGWSQALAIKGDISLLVVVFRPYIVELRLNTAT